MQQMKSIGQLFRETREGKGLTIKQISATIKIRESLIEAMEKGDYFTFSSDMHLKSFMRSYANFLGINEDKVMALYRRERQIKFEEENKNLKNTNENKIPLILSKFLNVKSLITLVVVVGLIGIIIYFVSLWKVLDQPPVLELKSPEQNAVMTTDTFVIEGFTGDPSVKVLLDGNEANYVDALGNFKINAKFSEPGTKKFILIAKNTFKQAEAQLDVTYKPPVIVAPKPKIRLYNKSNNNITLPVRRDGVNTFESVIISPRSTKEIEFDQTIDIKNFENNTLELYFNDEATPTTSITYKEFSIKIDNNKLFIIPTKNETTPTPKR
jgi:transcriptional regulator with XRE-family HTH domain